MSANEFLPPVPTAEAARELRARLGDAYDVMSCKKALYMARGNLEKAAESLTNGEWRAGKLISWDHASLTTKAAKLSQELGLNVDNVRETLMDCSGSEELTRRKLLGRPLLD